MKGVLIILDGLGDLPNKQLGEKTPLEIANKPSIDYLSKKSQLGRMYSVGENIIPESDAAVLSILGNKPIRNVRGWLEAFGIGLKLTRGDLALRTNFATVAKNKHIIDRRAGRTLLSSEAEKLAEAINARVKLPCKFVFKNTIQHRGVLVLRGSFSDNISNTDPEYHGKKRTMLKPGFSFSQPLDDEENSKYSANIVNRFIDQSYNILKEHPVNKLRIKKGLFPANLILTRDGGIELPKFNKFRKWLAIVNMPLEIGIAKVSEMDLCDLKYPDLKEYDVYENLHYSLKDFCKKAGKLLKKNLNKYEYAYVHFKETDVPGHDNKPLEKVKMIEEIDKGFFKEVLKFLEKKKIKVVVTADHSTPCKLKSHSSDPVPVMFCDWKSQKSKISDDYQNSERILKSEGEKFDEETCKSGELGKIMGIDLLKKVGFVS